MWFVWFAWAIVLIIAIAIDWYLASMAADIAAAKGYWESKWKWICFFFGIIGYILVAAMPDLATREELRKNRQSNGNSGNLGAPSETETCSQSVSAVSVQHDVKGQWRCKECGSINSRDSIFCSDCSTHR